MRYETVTVLPSPATLLALLEGAEFGVFRVGWVSSTFQLHCECQQDAGRFLATTYPEELAQRRVVGLAWLALDIFLPKSALCLLLRCGAYQVLREPETQAAQQTAELVVRVADADECVWPVQVVPVLCCPSGCVHNLSPSEYDRRTQVRPRLEKLRREGEAHGSEIGDTNEPASAAN